MKLARCPEQLDGECRSNGKSGKCTLRRRGGLWGLSGRLSTGVTLKKFQLREVVIGNGRARRKSHRHSPHFSDAREIHPIVVIRSARTGHVDFSRRTQVFGFEPMMSQRKNDWADGMPHDRPSAIRKMLATPRERH